MRAAGFWLQVIAFDLGLTISSAATRYERARVKLGRGKRKDAM